MAKLQFAAVLAVCLALGACGSKSGGAAGTSAAPGKVLTKADLPAPYSAADIANGQTIFIKCRNCHSVVPSEGNKTGPNLHGVFDRHPATQANFKYSKALQADKDEKWTGAELDKWLAKPKDYMPGTKMFFNGIDDANDRRDVIAYLMIASENADAAKTAATQQ